MPKLTIENIGEFEVAAGKRLILALTDDCKIDQLHACGGFARCTTCRVDITTGEPPEMTVAEKDVLTQRNLITEPHARLACQLNVDHDLTIKIVNRLTGSGRANAGSRPGDEIAPPPVWTTRD